jgi:hypothetical protein
MKLERLCHHLECKLYSVSWAKDLGYDQTKRSVLGPASFAGACRQTTKGLSVNSAADRLWYKVGGFLRQRLSKSP